MKRFTLLTIFCTLCTTLAISAQEGATTEKANLEAQVDSLKQCLAKAEKREKTKAKVKEVFSKYLKFSGYIQAGYDWNDKKDGTSTFHLRRARVSLAGTVFDNKKGGKADYRLQVDFARTPTIVDLYIRYQPVHEFGVQVGQFKLPISLENTDYNATKLEFVNYAMPVQRLARLGSGDMTGISATGRDIGVKLYGGFIHRDGFSIINYEVGAFNGAGINTKDNNKSKDIAARLTIQPLKLLKIAGYYQYGEGDGASLSSKYPAILAGAAENYNLKYLTYHRYGGGFDYNNDFLFARAEYLGGKTGDLSSEGAYGQVGYKFLKKCTVGVRFDYFDENKHAAGHQFNYSVALSYRPWKYLRLQAEYTLEQYRNMSAPRPFGNCLYLMVTGIF